MPEIPFTQFLRPDGRRKQEFIERPLVVYEAAQKIIAEGFHFECEVLQTGHVNFTISDDVGDHDQKICMNGPDVLKTVDDLILGWTGKKDLAT